MTLAGVWDGIPSELLANTARALGIADLERSTSCRPVPARTRGHRKFRLRSGSKSAYGR
jgi:hypothetical protein